MLTLTQAAVEVGRTRSTLFKAVKAGRLSASKDAQGQWLIDPVELHRVYVAVNVSQGNKTTQRDIVSDIANDTSEIVFLRRENELLRQQGTATSRPLAQSGHHAPDAPTGKAKTRKGTDHEAGNIFTLA